MKLNSDSLAEGNTTWQSLSWTFILIPLGYYLEKDEVKAGPLIEKMH